MDNKRNCRKHARGFVTDDEVHRRPHCMSGASKRRGVVIATVTGCLLITLFDCPAKAQKTEIGGSILDNFDDGDFEDGSPATWYTKMFPPREGRDYDASSGDFVIARGHSKSINLSVAYAELFDTLVSDVSIRTRSRMTKLQPARRGYGSRTSCHHRDPYLLEWYPGSARLRRPRRRSQ